MPETIASGEDFARPRQEMFATGSWELAGNTCEAVNRPLVSAVLLS